MMVSDPRRHTSDLATERRFEEIFSALRRLQSGGTTGGGTGAGVPGPPGATGAMGPAGEQGPIGPGGSGYTHDQPTPATVWTINHNLGQKPDVAVFNASDRAVIADVQHITVNQTIVTFLTSTAGYARLNAGPSGLGYSHDQPSAASTWTINHNLGKKPDVAVFNTGNQMLFADVQNPTINQTIVSFVTPTAGYARLN